MINRKYEIHHKDFTLDFASKTKDKIQIWNFSYHEMSIITRIGVANYVKFVSLHFPETKCVYTWLSTHTFILIIQTYIFLILVLFTSFLTIPLFFIGSDKGPIPKMKIIRILMSFLFDSNFHFNSFEI